MKKVLVVLALMFSMGAILVSCKEENKESNQETEMHEDHAADKADMAMNDVYQCTMNCEDGKTYDKEGNCPVCKMALKKVEGEDHDNDEGHEDDHDSGDEHDNDEDH